MKQKLLARLILGAFAGVAAIGAAQAGQITASSTNVAREVITTDTQAINSPTISYRFAGDIDATVQDQEFQVQFTLEDGAQWAGLPSDNAITITPTAGTDAGVPGIGGTDFIVVAKGFDDPLNPTVLYATIRVPTVVAGVWSDSLLDQPIVTLNAGGATTPATVKKLKTLVGDLVADFNASGKCLDNKSLFVNFKHFKLLSNPTAIAGAGNGVPDEHTRGGTDRAGIINFPTNLLVQLAPSTGTTKVDVSAANLAFVGAASGSDPAYVSPTLANLGTLTLKQNSSGYDVNLTNQYVLTGNAVGSGLTQVATASLANGNVEVEKVDVVVTASNGFVPGGVLTLDPSGLCATPIAGSALPITALNAAGPVTLTVPTAGVNAAFGPTGVGPIHVCYNVAGVTTPIPLSSFTAVGTLDKANAGVNNEQNNVCNGNLYSLGGGIKIDVRNYANSKDASGWQSVIRLINNNESRTVDVYGQLIQVDGLYGPWGKIATLAPRAVVNMTAAQIDALLVNAPAAGAGKDGDTSAQSTVTGSRLRVTSENASSLRVQNYMVNPATGAVMEFSSSQGVDYEGTIDRAPSDTGVAGGDSAQYISQDAQAGLNGK